MKKAGAFWNNRFYIFLKVAVIISFLLSYSYAEAAFKVITVPKNPSNLNVPHSAYNGKVITFKAIARDDGAFTPHGIESGAFIEYQWDFDGDMNFDSSYITQNPYNLSGYHTYTGYTRNKLISANIRARRTTEPDNDWSDWSYASYLIYIYHDVPETPNNGQNVIATSHQLSIMRDVAIDDGLWYLHNSVIDKSGSGASITGMINHQSGRHTAACAGVLWAFNLQGHRASYPIGTQDVPLNNDAYWQKDPYSETMLRLTNYVLNTLTPQQTNLNDEFNAEDAENESMRVAGTTNNYALRCDMGITYDNAIVLGALAVSGLEGTTVKASNSNVSGKKMEYVVQELVDWLAWAQNDAGDSEGGWYYTPNAGPEGWLADASAAQWVYIGLEAAEMKMADDKVYVNKKCKNRVAVMLKNNQHPTFGCARYRNATTDQNFQLTGGAVVGGAWLGWDTFPHVGETGADDQPYLPYSNLKKHECRTIFDRYMNYISTNANWLAPNSYGKGQYGDGDWWSSNSQGATYAMYSIQKGLRTMRQEPVTLTDPNNSQLTHNWFNEYSVYYINNQKNIVDLNNPDNDSNKFAGSWADARFDSWIGHSYMFRELTSAFALLILTPSVFEAKPVAYGTASPMNPIEGCAGSNHGKVTFDHHMSFTVDPQRSLSSFKWMINVTVDESQYDSLDWDDPDYVTDEQGQTITHTYQNHGIYKAVLRVEDDKVPAQYSYYTINDINVQSSNLRPSAVITAVAPSVINNGLITLRKNQIAYLSGENSADPNTSCGDSITAYEWDINGDGTFGDLTTQNVNIDVDDPQWDLLYGVLLPATAQVWLRVKDANEQYSDPVSVTLRIYSDIPKALFYIYTDTPITNQTITFDANESQPSTPEFTLVEYEWNFGDGSPVSSGTNIAPTHSYSSLDTYTVQLRVRDNDGSSNWSEPFTRDVTITSTGPNQNPIAKPGGPYYVSSCQDSDGLDLDGTLSYDPDNGDTIVSYEWSLIDPEFRFEGSNYNISLSALTESGVSIADPFSKQPSYEVRLRVTDNHGNTSIASTTVTLFGCGPVAIANATPTYIVCGQQVTFDGTASYHLNPNQSIVSYEWDFDGDENYDATGAVIEHQFDPSTLIEGATETTYTVTLKVTDDMGVEATATVNVTLTIINVSPVAVIDQKVYTTEKLITPFPVLISGKNSYDPNEPCDYIKDYWWDTDGDGKFGPEDLNGTFCAQGYGYGGYGGYGSPSLTLGGNNETASTGFLPRSYQYSTETSFEPYDGYDTGGYDSGGYDSSDFDVVDTDNSDYTGKKINIANPNWQKDSSYVIELLVKDTFGAESTDYTLVNVTKKTYHGYEGSQIQFDASHVFFCDRTVSEYHWDLDNDGYYEYWGKTSYNTWYDNDIYEIGLQIYDNFWNAYSDRADVDVLNVNPDVDCPSNYTVYLNEAINLRYATFYDPGTLDTHLVSISNGDGTVTEKNIAETDRSNHYVNNTPSYSTSGNYEVDVTVTDDDGGSGNGSFELTVLDPSDTYKPKTEEPVNTDPNGHKDFPAVASNGQKYLVVWQWFNPAESNSYGIYGCFVDNEGHIMSSEFRINNYTTGDQKKPAVASDGTNFLVTWQGDGPGGKGIYSRTITANGVLGTETIVQETAPAVEKFDGFETNSLPNPPWSRYSASGTSHYWNTTTADKYEGTYSVATPTTFNRYASSSLTYTVTSTQMNNLSFQYKKTGSASNDWLYLYIDGYFINSWNNNRPWTPYTYINLNAGTHTIEFRFYKGSSNSSTRAFIDNFKLTPTGTVAYAKEPDVAYNGSKYLIVWDKEDIYGRAVSKMGTTLGNEFLINYNQSGTQENPSVASCNGKFYTVWETPYLDYNGDAIAGRLIDNDGNMSWGDTRINTYVVNDQVKPSIASSGENYMVVWQSNGQDTDTSSGIFGQMLNPSGSLVNSEFQVNTKTELNQIDPDVCSDGDNYMVTYSGKSNEPDNFDIYSQYMSFNGGRLGNEMFVNTYTTGSQDNPAIGSGGGNFLNVWEKDLDNIDSALLVVNIPPTAEANGVYSGTDYYPIQLTSAGSTDPDGTIVSYAWDLDGDGQFDDSTAEHPIFTWYEGGQKTIKLRVIDDGGSWGIDSATVNVDFLVPIELRIELEPDNTATLYFTGQPNKEYEIWYSDNKFDNFPDNDTFQWHVAGTEYVNPVDNEGTYHDAGGNGRVPPYQTNYRYYRVVLKESIAQGKPWASQDIAFYYKKFLWSGRNFIGKMGKPYPIQTMLDKNYLKGGMSATESTTTNFYSGYVYNLAYLFDFSGSKSWLMNTSGTNIDNNIIDSGKGFIINVTPDVTGSKIFPMVGLIERSDTIGIPVVTGDYSIITWPYTTEVPVSNCGLLESGFKGGDVSRRADKIYFWNAQTQKYENPIYYCNLPGINEWRNHDQTPCTKIIKPGDAMLIKTLYDSPFTSWRTTRPYPKPTRTMNP